MTSPRIGWIGTGVMGNAMAHRVLRAGYPLKVHTRTKSKAQSLIDSGAIWADTPADAANGTAICCSIVSLPSDVQQVHLGEHGTLQAPTKPEILIDFTTSSPGMAERLAEHATAHGAMALDAPVSGGDVGAREGRLSIMVGGPEAAFQSAQPLFEHLGKTIVHHGDPGAGQRAKLVNQILVAGGMLGLAEAMAFCEQSGLNHERVLQSVSAGAAGSWAVDHLAPRVARGDFDPGFFVAHLKKDLGLVLEAGADLGLPLPAMQLAFKAYQALSENGMGTLGTQALAGVASGKLGEVPGFSPQHS
ncbi:MAG: NAD(P)-dependent oxidoreductase [Planctomycetota bacterium]|nr:NAD(P)-dependent oxidoreductase [Phycisphaerales bacterium]MEC8354368.1 NAD(P)-dependent oxidoreductase [Planctomycetota bacterium]MEC8385655.1 NAD(P)-dependent oxidoreductase [Planctomycetota bacterium]MEC8413540.1 NAD(P)-dependent oxidoreductase [Planctomycetota bacterium]MEC8855574.1 NAD(P)-dependent oxidoreductase [Planctomycetota bacterium]